MSGCPSVRVRNTGSGYVKTGGGGDISLAARLAEREAQDRAAQLRVTVPEAVHPTPHYPSVSGATRAGTSSVANTSQAPEKR